MGALLIVLGLVVLGVALVALVRGHLPWIRMPGRAGAAVLAAVGVVVLAVGGVFTVGGLPDTAADRAASTASAPPTTIAPVPPPVAPSPAPGAVDAAVWDALAQCEAGGDWAVDTGNGLYGGMQLDQETWLEYGGGAFAPLANQASREQQIVVAERVRAVEGFAPWGSCSEELGLL